MWLGRIIGSFFGFLLAKIPGAILGYIVGNLFDKGFLKQRLSPQQQAHIQHVFFRISFLVMGHIAKADGRISEDEIRVAKRIMDQMRLTSEQKRQAVAYFNEGKQPHFNFEAAINELADTCRHQKLLLRMFIEMQFQAAIADGAIGPNKQAILNTICQRLGIGVSFAQFAQMYENLYGGAQQQQQRQYQQARRTYRPSLSDDYKLLGISENASKHEIKRAYRRLMSQHHPDKLIAQGLPEEMIKMTTDKTQKIQAAYERIRQARGF